jgi:Right handed beta helix region
LNFSSRRYFLALTSAAILGLVLAASAESSPSTDGSLKQTKPLVIENRDGAVLEGLRIASTTGDCITIHESRNVTIRNSQIGPCRGRGIFVDGGSNISIVGNSIQTEFKPEKCCDQGGGIFARSTNDLVVDQNKVAYSETNIQLMAVDGARISNNSLANPLGPFPRGQQIQVASWPPLPPSNDVLIEGNTMLATTDALFKYPENQEDAVSLFLADNVTVKDNMIQGGSSASGCGIIADYGSNHSIIEGNRVYNTGQCGIGIASGRDHVVDKNYVLLTTSVNDGGNTAIYTWKQYEADCGNIRITNNIATFIRTGGQHSAFWDGGGCEPVELSDNVWNEEAYPFLAAEFEGVENVPADFAGLEEFQLIVETSGSAFSVMVAAAIAVIFVTFGLGVWTLARLIRRRSRLSLG